MSYQKNFSLRDFLNFRISSKWFLSYSIICADGGYRYPQHIWKRDYRRTGGVRNLHSQYLKVDYLGRMFRTKETPKEWMSECGKSKIFKIARIYTLESIKGQIMKSLGCHIREFAFYPIETIWSQLGILSRREIWSYLPFGMVILVTDSRLRGMRMGFTQEALQ